MSPTKAIVIGWGGGVVEVFGTVEEDVDGVVEDGVAGEAAVALAEATACGAPADVSDEAELHPAASASAAHPRATARATAALRDPARIGRAYFVVRPGLGTSVT
jgi:hypothetical protein